MKKDIVLSEYCGMKASEDVVSFISNFLNHTKDKTAISILQQQFAAGYCYYFAVMLKSAFNRGEVCWCAPYGHLCWVDDDGVPYDIYGICISEADYFIPVSFLGDALDDFKHTDKVFNATPQDIQDIIDRYLQSKE